MIGRRLATFDEIDAKRVRTSVARCLAQAWSSALEISLSRSNDESALVATDVLVHVCDDVLWRRSGTATLIERL